MKVESFSLTDSSGRPLAGVRVVDYAAARGQVAEPYAYDDAAVMVTPVLAPHQNYRVTVLWQGPTGRRGVQSFRFQTGVDPGNVGVELRAEPGCGHTLPRSACSSRSRPGTRRPLRRPAACGTAGT